MFTPLYWLLVTLLLAIFVKQRRWKKAFGWAGVVIFILFTSPFLFEQYARWWQPDPVLLPPQSHYSTAIVAGGFGSVDYDGHGYFNGSADRFIQAVTLFQTGVVDKILISGGNSKKNDKNFTEAAWARQQMIKIGIPDTAILSEDASTRTLANATNSKQILDSINAKPPYLLITSAFHMPRAVKLFERQGLEVVPFPCNYTEGRGPISWQSIIPDPALLIYWSRYVKESVWWIVKG